MRKRPAGHGEVTHSQNGKPDRESSRPYGERQPAAPRARDRPQVAQTRQRGREKASGRSTISRSSRADLRHSLS